MRQNPSFKSYDISGSHDAIRAFGEDDSLLVARPNRNCCKFWFTVPESYYAIVTNHGIQMDFVDINGKRSIVWPPGLHLGPPWMKVSHLVPKQNVVMETTVTDCMTKDNVSVQVDVSIIFRIMGDADKNEDPRNVYNFVHHMAVRGIEEQLQAYQSEHIRTIVRQLDHSELFGIQRLGKHHNVNNVLLNVENTIHFDEKSTPMAMLNELDDEEEGKCFNIENFESLVSPITQQNIAEDDRTFESNSLLKKTLQISLNEKVSDCGIEILDVIVLGVGFPSQVITKLTQHHVAMSLEKERQAQNKKEVVLFKQNEEINTLQQTFEEEKEEILQEGELSQLMESMEKRFEQSETDQSILKIRATAEFNIESINAESEYTVQKIIDIAKLEASKIKHDSVAEAELAKSDARGEVSIIEANAAMEGAYFESAGEKALLHAEATVYPTLRKCREFTSKKLKIQAQKALAENDMLVITGTSGGTRANKIIMMDAALLSQNNMSS